MKTKIILGKSVNDLTFKPMGVSLSTSIHYSVKISVINSVINSVSNSINISLVWKIRL